MLMVASWEIWPDASNAFDSLPDCKGNTRGRKCEEVEAAASHTQTAAYFSCKSLHGYDSRQDDEGHEGERDQRELPAVGEGDPKGESFFKKMHYVNSLVKKVKK